MEFLSFLLEFDNLRLRERTMSCMAAGLVVIEFMGGTMASIPTVE